MRPMRLPLALSLLLFCPAVFAQGPELQWRTVTTKHFRVHYPVPYEAWSLRAASRLESNAKAGEILVSEATANAARSRYQLVPREPISVKNRVQPVPLYEIEWQHAVSNA